MNHDEKSKFQKKTFLEKLAQEYEIPFSQVDALLEKTHGDHRDYYPIACLCSEGYVGFLHKINLYPEELRKSRGRTNEIATYFYLYKQTRDLKSKGKAVYDGFSLEGSSDSPEAQFLYTEKTGQYLEEIEANSKRKWKTLVTILITSATTAFFTTLFPLFIK